MPKLIPAKVRETAPGEYTAIEPGQYNGHEIVKLYCYYDLAELQEIIDDIRYKNGGHDGPIIEVES